VFPFGKIWIARHAGNYRRNGRFRVGVVVNRRFGRVRRDANYLYLQLAAFKLLGSPRLRSASSAASVALRLFASGGNVSFSFDIRSRLN
jgi:hypothetical protein